MATAQEEGWAHPLSAHGQQPNRGTFSAAPWESVDMASGNAMLTFPGLTFPGVNGLEFQFAAIANLGGGGLTWSVGVPGPAMVAFITGVANPVVLAMDGGQHTRSPRPAAGTERSGAMRSRSPTTARR